MDVQYGWLVGYGIDQLAVANDSSSTLAVFGRFALLGNGILATVVDCGVAELVG
jgi:hypothetical protein